MILTSLWCRLYGITSWNFLKAIWTEETVIVGLKDGPMVDLLRSIQTVRIAQTRWWLSESVGWWWWTGWWRAWQI